VATTSADTVAADLLRWMEVPQHPNVFALGTFGRQVTFASQQTRALNLIWALAETGRLERGNQVAVVGAGLGGLMSVTAAHAAGCSVHLYEKASQACPVQRGNDIRFIHPNILNWPDEGSETAETEFPFLNWTAASTRGVIKQIDLQWKRIRGDRVRRYFNYQVNRLYMVPQRIGSPRPALTANRVVEGEAAGGETAADPTPGFLEHAYDFVILAIGFGDEQELGGVPLLSYWENDSLHQETGRGRTEILVSGCGDGGLIDALRLRIRNFDHADFVRRFVLAGESSGLIADLRRIDGDLRPHALDPDISLRFRTAYDAIPPSPALARIETYFREHRRNDTSVSLNSPAAGPLSFQASLLNRFATHLAMRHADLHYLSGRVVAERVASGAYRVAFQRVDADLTEERTFDRVIVRHGPRSAIRGLIPESSLDQLRSLWSTHIDETTKPHWRTTGAERSRQLFGVDPDDAAPLPQDVLGLALATFEPAYRHFVENEGEQSIAVGRHDGKAGFVVTQKPGSLRKAPAIYAGVLVQYVLPNSPQYTEGGEPTTPPDAANGRKLQVGIGIYNYDATVRAGGPRALHERGYAQPGIGTLGAFGTDHSGARYLISMAHVLSPGLSAEVGDRIFLEGESPNAGSREIAIFSHLGSDAQPGDSSREGVSAAAAKLLDDIEPAYERFPPEWRPRRVGGARVGDEVVAVGRSSIKASGVIRRIADAYLPLGVLEGTGRAGEYVEISARASLDFSSPGDSGALVVSREGTAIGLIAARYANYDLAGDRGVSVARSLEVMLNELGLIPLFDK
jgi:hypothetical protein